MQVNPVSDKQSFEGNVIVNGKISAQQRHLFNLHKGALEKMVKDLPFDLFVEQSKSKKTIKLSTNVKNSISQQVYKNEQNFVEVAHFVIADAKEKSEIYQRMVNAEKILEMQKKVMLGLISGDYKGTREAEKDLAKFEVEHFEAYKLTPNVELKVPSELYYIFSLKNLKYRVYRAFTRKTNEEKELIKLKREYYKELESQGKKRQTVKLEIPRYLLY